MGYQWDQGRNKKVSGNKWKWTHNSPKPMGHREGSPEREVHSNTGLPTKDRKVSSKQPNPTLKEVLEQQQTKPRVRMKEVIKIRAELNDIESKKQSKESMNPGAGSLKR